MATTVGVTESSRIVSVVVELRPMAAETRSILMLRPRNLIALPGGDWEARTYFLADSR